MQETWVQPLGQEDPLEEKIAIHSCIFAWEILQTVEPGRPQSIRLQRDSGKQLTHTSNFKSVIVKFPLKYVAVVLMLIIHITEIITALLVYSTRYIVTFT